MQDTRTALNCLRSPASSDSEPVLAFHLPSGEQGGFESQGTFPLLTTSKVRIAEPTVLVLTMRVVYRTRRLPIRVSFAFSEGCGNCGCKGFRRTTRICSPAGMRAVYSR